LIDIEKASRLGAFFCALIFENANGGLLKIKAKKYLRSQITTYTFVAK
jgi:hypothetical protein